MKKILLIILLAAMLTACMGKQNPMPESESLEHLLLEQLEQRQEQRAEERELFAAPGKQYYVANSGNDSNAGTQAAPFKNIQKCATVATAGDTCNINPGTYTEEISPSSSGIQGSPITFRRDGEGTVLVKAKDWNIFNIAKKNWIVVDGLTLNGGDIAMVCYYVWDGSFNVLKDSTITNCGIGAHIIGGNPSSVEYGAVTDGNSVINNHFIDMDINGTFNLKECVYVKNYMPAGDSVSFVRNTLIEGNLFEGCGEATQNTGATWPLSGGEPEYTIYSITPFRTTVRNNYFINNEGEQGIASSYGDEIVIEGNIFINDSGSGSWCYIKTGGLNIRVNNNVFLNCDDAGLYLTAASGDVYNNTFYNLPGRGIWIHNNYVQDGGLRIFNNIFYAVGTQIYKTGLVGSVILNNNWTTGNPQFISTDPANPNFMHLQSNSPACGMGAFPCGDEVPTFTPSLIPNTPTKNPRPRARSFRA